MGGALKNSESCDNYKGMPIITQFLNFDVKIILHFDFQFLLKPPRA